MWKWLLNILPQRKPIVVPPRPVAAAASDTAMQDAYRRASGSIERISRPPNLADEVGPEPVSPLEPIDPTFEQKLEPTPEPIDQEFRSSFDIFHRDTSPVEHPLALCRKSDGSIEEISHKKLHDRDRFLKIRRMQLFTPDLRYRLGARKGPQVVPHFWILVEQSKQRYVVPTDLRSDAEREFADLHERRIGHTVKELRRLQPHELFTVNWDAYNENFPSAQGRPDVSKLSGLEQFTIANLNGYNWQANRRLINLSGTNVRPDIVGAHPGGTDKFRPKVFIEVVHTHFPEANTWNAYLEHSFREPLIVLFDFTQEFHYHLHVREANGANVSATNDMRAVHFIWQGSLMKNTNPERNGIVEYSSDGFRYRMATELADLAKRPKQGRSNGNNPSDSSLS
jgi:hypothetical protein